MLTPLVRSAFGKACQARRLLDVVDSSEASMRKERKVAKEATRGIEKAIAAGTLDFSALCELHAIAAALDQCGFALEPAAADTIRRRAVDALDTLKMSPLKVPSLDDVSDGFIKGDLPYVQAVLTLDGFYRALNDAAGDWAEGHRSKPVTQKMPARRAMPWEAPVARGQPEHPAAVGNLAGTYAKKPSDLAIEHEPLPEAPLVDSSRSPSHSRIVMPRGGGRLSSGTPVRPVIAAVEGKTSSDTNEES